MAKMILVVAFDIPDDDRAGFEKSQEMLQTIKPMFAEESGVQVYGATKETADAIIGFLVDGLPEPEELP